MKKIISFVLAALMLVSAVPTALATNDYSQGTQVVYQATGSESYTITVPAQLTPGGSGTVTLSGTWADNRVVTVTADPSVTLTNSIKSDDQKVLNVTFAGISEAGSNTGSQTFTEGVSVAEIENALFGIWSGKFNYNVEIANAATETGCDTLTWDCVTDGKEVVAVPSYTSLLAKVSDAVPTYDDLASGFSVTVVADDESESADVPADEVDEIISMVGDGFLFIGDWIFIVPYDNFYLDVADSPYEESLQFSSKGVYFGRMTNIEQYCASFTIHGYTGFQHSEHCGH